MKNVQLPNEQKLNEIRGKMLVAKATKEELHQFLYYVTVIEGLVEQASMEDFYGTGGYRHYLGWD